MKKHPLVLGVVATTVIAAGAWLVSTLGSPAPEALAPAEGPQRIISLMPPITETLHAIGAGDRLVGRSDFCAYPRDVESLPGCGTALTPNHEAIVRLRPTMILANRSEATAREELQALGTVELLPWLTVDEVIASTRRLGQLTGRVAQAEQLAEALETVLLKPEPSEGPRVLLVMLPQPGRIDPVGFLRRNSMHGQILSAAGGRNAVDEDVSGVPELSLERVLQLDPDMIILVGNRDDLADTTRAQILDDWRRITPLSAIQENRIGILSGAHFYGAGRRLLRAVEELRAEIERLRP